MSVTVLPSNSFWAMLPQITQNAIGTYWQAQDRKTSKQERERAQMLEKLGILQSQASAGADVNDQISGILQSLGMPDVTPAETPAQLRERIMNAKDLVIEAPKPRVADSQRLTMATSVTPSGSATLGQSNVRQVVPQPEKKASQPEIRIKAEDRFTDNQFRKAGLPTRHDQLRERTEASGFHVTTQMNDILRRMASGENVTPYEAMIVGKQTREQVDLSNAAQAADYVRTVAPAYVQDWIARNGGRVNPAQIQQAIGEAYGGFMERFGQVIPSEQRTNTQAMFGEAMYNALMQQSEMDLRRDQLAMQRYLAEIRMKPNDPEASGKLVDQLNRVADGIRRDLETEFGTNRMQMMLRRMQEGGDPSTISQTLPGYDRFVEMMTRLQQAREAAVLVSRNLTNDPRVQNLLDNVAGSPLPTRESQPAAGSDPYAQYRQRDGRIKVSPAAKRDMQIRGIWDDRQYVESPDGLGSFSNAGPM